MPDEDRDDGALDSSMDGDTLSSMQQRQRSGSRDSAIPRDRHGNRIVTDEMVAEVHERYMEAVRAFYERHKHAHPAYADIELVIE